MAYCPSVKYKRSFKEKDECDLCSAQLPDAWDGSYVEKVGW